MEQLKEEYPEFLKIVDLISKQNPLQRKQIKAFINRQDIGYWVYAEEICDRINRHLLISGEAQTEAARCYNRMTMDFLREQIRFSKTGIYCVDDAVSAEKNIYSRPDIMRYYMVGLFLSYLLWPNHFEIIHFFKEYILQIPTAEHYLEIAPGHGLFTVEAMRRFPGLTAVLVDISETSIKVTSEILSAFCVDYSRFNFINCDFLKVSLDSDSFDFISMGEVLEHVNDPLSFLKQARQLLHPGGIIFMSTCVNCPAIDHVYNFCNTGEIRKLVYDAGLSIAVDKELPVATMSHGQSRKGLEAFNYCCILSRE